MSHYLVTGGCGFIGSHLVDALIAAGHEVTILDDLSTGKREFAHKNAELIVGDVRDKELIHQLFDKIEGCFHLAAIASVERSLVEWSETHTVNTVATVQLFEASSKLQTKVPIVYASSAAIYGENINVPLSEEEAPCPRTPYAVDKYSCELHAHTAAEKYGISATGLRFFNVYGPRQDPHSPYSGVISIFTNCAVERRPITIYGSGEQCRDFIYVADVVCALVKSMEITEQAQAPVSNISNVCTGRGTTINQLAELIVTAYEEVVPIHHKYDHPVYITESIGDPSLMHQILGIRAETSLQEGLKQTLKYTMRERDVA